MQIDMQQKFNNYCVVQVMIVMELMGLGDLSKYLWENYR